MHDTGKGYNMGDPQKFLGALLQNPGRNHTIRPNKLPGYSGRTMRGGKEDAEACKLEEKHWKKSTGPVLSLGDHEESITNLLK